jgi:hypothetical protein
MCIFELLKANAIGINQSKMLDPKTCIQNKIKSSLKNPTYLA